MGWKRTFEGAVKFLEDDIVATGIAAPTAYEKYFIPARVGAAVRPKNRTWSTWDNMFRSRGYKRQRIMPSRKRTRLPYRKTYRRFTRRRTRRRSTWGTRVRRAALRSAESKRHVTTVTQELIDDSTLDYTAISQVPEHGAAADGVDQKNARIGTSIVTTGISSRIHFQNQTTEPMLVRYFWYYKKRDESDVTAVFLSVNKETEITLPNLTSSSYFQGMTARLGNKKTRIIKSGSCVLSEKEAGTMGTDSKILKFWIPFKRVMNFEGTAEGTVNQNYDIYFGIMCFNKEGTAFTTSGVGAGDENVLLCQQQHVLYFRDP